MKSITRRDLWLLIPGAISLFSGNYGGSPPWGQDPAPQVVKAPPQDRELTNTRYLHLLGFGERTGEKGPLLGWHATEYPDPVLAGTPEGLLQKEKEKSGKKQWAAFLAATSPVQGRVVNRWLRRYPGIIYLESQGDKPTSTPRVRPLLEHVNMEMRPSLLPVVVGSTVDFINRDKCRDNIMSASANAKFSLWFTGPDQLKTYKFTKAGPVPLLCKVHPDEWGTVMVAPGPFFALTDKRGRFLIPHVPPGKWKLHLWHPKLRPTSRQIEVKKGAPCPVEFKKLKRK